MGYTTLEIVFNLLYFPIYGFTIFFVTKKRVDPRYFFSPPTIFFLFYFYYFTLSPNVAVMTGETFYLGNNFRSSFEIGWMAGLAAYLMTVAGFFLTPVRASYSSSLDDLQSSLFLCKYGLIFIFLTLCAFFGWVGIGGVFNFQFAVTNEDSIGIQQEASALKNLLYNMWNLGIPGLLMLYLSGRRRVLFFCSFLLIGFIYLLAGFRYRILLMVFSFVCAGYLSSGKKVSLLKVFWVLIAFAVVSGMIGAVRSYSVGGLDFQSAASLDANIFISSFFSESNIFYGLTSLLEYVPEKKDYLYFSSIFYFFTLLIPRAIWVEKPYPEMFLYIQDALNSPFAETAGTAVPYFAEYYVSFGWVGLVLLSFLFGALCKYFWIVYVNKNNKAIGGWMVYSLFFGYIFYMMSRGYLAQIIQDSIFVLLPAIWVGRRLS